ncbi:hypothetical protein ACXR2T_09930 [Leucobacter sp. HY1910]
MPLAIRILTLMSVCLVTSQLTGCTPAAPVDKNTRFIEQFETAPGVLLQTNNSANLELALLAVGAPVKGVRTAEQKSDQTTDLRVSVTLDGEILQLDAALLKRMLKAVEAHWPDEYSNIVLGTYRPGALAIEAGEAARALGLDEDVVDLSGHLTLDRDTFAPPAE